MSCMRVPCVRVAAMVVSEIKERLSPNMAPPTTEATVSGRPKSAFCATEVAMGTSTVMVPTLVPMDMEIRQAMRKRPGMAKVPGIKFSSRWAVLSTPPAALAIPLKAPAIRKIKSMMVMFTSPILLAQSCILSTKRRLRFCIKATIKARPKATTTDMT